MHADVDELADPEVSLGVLHASDGVHDGVAEVCALTTLRCARASEVYTSHIFAGLLVVTRGQAVVVGLPEPRRRDDEDRGACPITEAVGVRSIGCPFDGLFRLAKDALG